MPEVFPITADVTSRSIGSGEYGRVYKVDYYGTPTALKVFKTTATEKPNFSPEAKKVFEDECSILKSCRHDNIVQYIAIVDATTNGELRPALVMTLMDASLMQYLSIFKAETIPPHKEVKIAHDISKALNYLHVVKKIAHGDLHWGNVLLKNCISVEGPEVKLCDFGVPKVISKVSEKAKVPNPLSVQSLRFETDIRKFGTIMWEIHMKDDLQLYKGTKWFQNLERIKSRPMYMAVQSCWDDSKPSAKKILGDLEELKKEFPVVHPHSELLETIKSQQQTISMLKKEIDQFNKDSKKD